MGWMRGGKTTTKTPFRVAIMSPTIGLDKRRALSDTSLTFRSIAHISYLMLSMEPLSLL